MFVSNTSADGSYQIANSLRCRASATTRMTRTPSSAPTLGTKATFFCWFKRGALGVRQQLASAGNSSDGNQIELSSGDALQLSSYGTPSATFNLLSSALYRDPSAWQFLLVGFDTTQATAANRIIAEMNGVAVTWSSATYPTQNAALSFCAQSVLQALGIRGGDTQFPFDGEVAVCGWVDGQTLGSASFGQFNSDSEWTPKAYAGTYGANGSILKFDNGTSLTTLGYDSSGNGNNWTLNNFSLTVGATYDWLTDTPTNNYAVLNPLVKFSSSYGSMALSNANLQAVSPSAAGIAGTACSLGTVATSSGKFYFEVAPDASAAAIGVASSAYTPNGTNEAGVGVGSVVYYGASGNVYNQSGTSAAYGAAFTTEVVGVAVDIASGKVWFSKAGVWQASGDPATNTAGVSFAISGDITAIVSDLSGVGALTCTVNFGQRPFTYTPPSGFKALCTANL